LSLSIREISTKKEKERFIRFPWKIYNTARTGAAAVHGAPGLSIRARIILLSMPP